jgi:hypothetical protein
MVWRANEWALRRVSRHCGNSLESAERVAPNSLIINGFHFLIGLICVWNVLYLHSRWQCTLNREQALVSITVWLHSHGSRLICQLTNFLLLLAERCTSVGRNLDSSVPCWQLQGNSKISPHNSRKGFWIYAISSLILTEDSYASFHAINCPAFSHNPLQSSKLLNDTLGPTLNTISH